MKTLLWISLLPCLALEGAAQKAARPVGGERHVYKTVGEVELPLYLHAPAGHKATARTPAIVFFFGGGWRAGSPGQFEQHCKHLAKRGMVAITVDYRVSSRHDVKVEDCIADARSAMRWVRGNAGKLGIDPGRIASGGGSAGGHLAAAVQLIDDFDADSEDEEVSASPDLMVLFNPALAVAADDRLPAEYSRAISERLKGRSHGPLRGISPMTYAARKQPPCIMFFGTADNLLVGAEAFRKASADAGNDCVIVTYEGEGHGFFNHGKKDNKYYDLTVAEMDKFLTKHGFLPAATAN
jgi:acetyl esterase/lipase